jgi:hypothetical protein
MKKLLKNFYLLTVVFGVVAAATYSGFSSKWGLSDGLWRLTLDRMFNGTAHKPFVYRQLIPTIANQVAKATPQSVSTLIAKNYNFGPFRYYSKASNLVDNSDLYKFKWIIVYWLGFGFLFLSLFVLREILIHFGISPIVSIFAPSLFVLCMPIIQTVGGHVYDFSELFFMSLILLLILKNFYFTTLIFTFFATLNKESFLFFIPSLLPFILQAKEKRKAYTLFALMIALSATVNFWIKYEFASNQGQVAEIHLWHNIISYLNPATYFDFDDSYGLLAPRGFNIFNLLLGIILVKTGWSKMCSTIRFHSWIALGINFPLFIVCCWTNEIRNLSFLYITAVILIAYCTESFQEHSVHEPLKSKNFNI